MGMKNSENGHWLTEFLLPFDVGELALYREEWKRSLLIDWPEIWKIVKKLR